MCFASAAVAGGLVAGSTLGAASVDIALISASLSIAASAKQAEASQDAAKFNEGAAKVEATQAISASSAAAGVVLNRASGVASSQVAALGGSGFDVNKGDAVAIIGATLQRGARDAAIIRSRGSRAAAAAGIRAQNARIAGRSARNVAIDRIAGTIINTTSAVSSTWYQFRET